MDTVSSLPALLLSPTALVTAESPSLQGDVLGALLIKAQKIPIISLNHMGEKTPPKTVSAMVQITQIFNFGGDGGDRPCAAEPVLRTEWASSPQGVGTIF